MLIRLEIKQFKGIEYAMIQHYYKSFGEEKRERAEAKSDPKRKRGRPAQGKKADQENLPQERTTPMLIRLEIKQFKGIEYPVIQH